ncbi:MAG: hypothetical protein WCT85_05475 [Parachlamydiales bacterium]|jgi:hypothetical protein
MSSIVNFSNKASLSQFNSSNKTQILNTYFARIIKSISKIALPIISLAVLINLPMVNADRFTDCMDNCNKTADHPLPLLICQTLCFLFARG